MRAVQSATLGSPRILPRSAAFEQVFSHAAATDLRQARWRDTPVQRVVVKVSRREKPPSKAVQDLSAPMQALLVLHKLTPEPYIPQEPRPQGPNGVSDQRGLSAATRIAASGRGRRATDKRFSSGVSIHIRLRST